jgi:hypothetical protein
LYLALGGWCLFLAMLAADEARRVVRFALASIAVAMVAVGAVGVRHHLRAWLDAAALRDRVLASAVESVQQAACSHAQFTEAPDSIRGAYLFRNGLDEALRARGVTVSPAAPARCRFAWNGSAFLAK